MAAGSGNRFKDRPAAVAAHATFKEKNLRKWTKTLNMRKRACNVDTSAASCDVDVGGGGDATTAQDQAPTSCAKPVLQTNSTELVEKPTNSATSSQLKTYSTSPSQVKFTSKTTDDVTPYFVNVSGEDENEGDDVTRQQVAYDDMDMFNDSSAAVTASTSNAKRRKAKRKPKKMPADLAPHMRKYWMQRYRLFSRFDQGIKMDTGACVTSCARSLGQTQSTSTCSESGGTSESNRATAAVSSSRTSV